MVERYGGGVITVTDYDPEWPALFEAESARLRAALGTLVRDIEHIGSTAVPGLPAKPVIDLLVGVRSLDEARATSIPPMARMGYAYLPEYESFLPAEMFFRKGVDGPWTHHVHVMEPSSPQWRRFIVFRDHLRSHPQAARDYARLKRALAMRHGDDIAGYRFGKGGFVETTMQRALDGGDTAGGGFG